MAWAVTRYDVHNGELSVVRARSSGDLNDSKTKSPAERNCYNDFENDKLDSKQVAKALQAT